MVLPILSSILKFRGTDLPLSSSLDKEDEVGSSRREDMISLLPDSLLCHILSFLTTEEAVCTSVLSSRWRNLWRWVPTLELESYDFPNDEACVDFIDKFLNFQSLREFSLFIYSDDSENDASLYEPCLGKLIKRKIQDFEVLCYRNTKIPLTLPLFEALVCLSLKSVRLNDFESLSLPCLKTTFLEEVIFPSNTSSWVLDTPRLEYLNLIDNQFKSFNIISMSASVEVDIDVDFELKHHDISERNIIYNLLNNFPAIGEMTISWKTLKLIHCLKHMNPLPKFRYLTRMRATMTINNSPELLPIVLESCPNLKRLTLVLTCFKPIRLGIFRFLEWQDLVMDDLEGLATSLSNVLSYCLVCSLEYVEIQSSIRKKATTRKLVRYFLENATSLKKLVLRLEGENLFADFSDGLFADLFANLFAELWKQYFDSERRSHLCQFEIFSD